MFTDTLARYCPGVSGPTREVETKRANERLQGTATPGVGSGASSCVKFEWLPTARFVFLVGATFGVGVRRKAG